MGKKKASDKLRSLSRENLTLKNFYAMLGAPLDEALNAKACRSRRVHPVEVLRLYAIIKTGGKQYKVAEGNEIIIEKLDAEEGSSVTFEEVLAIGEGEEIKIGRPLVEGAKVTGSVVKVGKGPKIAFSSTNTRPITVAAKVIVSRSRKLRLR